MGEKLLKQVKSDSPPQAEIWAEMLASPLYELGLIDQEFFTIRRNESTVGFLRLLNAKLAEKKSEQNTFLIEKAILTKSDFQSNAKKPRPIDSDMFVDFLTPSKKLITTLSYLIDKKVLTPNTLWNKFLLKKNFYNRAIQQEDFDWEHLTTSGIVKIKDIDTSTDGFDAIEIKALQEDLLGSPNHRDHLYPVDKHAHPLVQKLRGQENTQKISEQIGAVIGPRGGESLMEDFGKVFNFYLRKAAFYTKLLARDRIPKKERVAERAKNIRLVNDRQYKKLKGDKNYGPDTQYYDPKKRHFDIYARYGHGQMDPLQLAFISRAAEWYILDDGGRSRLFNSVRIVPFRSYDNPTREPLLSLAACRGSTLLDVSGFDFESSMLGANRTFLTHSDSKEASKMQSIPIIGLATYKNTSKHVKDEGDFVVFQGDFDPKDNNRRYDTRTGPKGNTLNVNGDIAGLINEALRTMVEVEDKEIERAEQFQAEEAAAEAAAALSQGETKEAA